MNGIQIPCMRIEPVLQRSEIKLTLEVRVMPPAHYLDDIN